MKKNQNSDLLTQIPGLPFQCLDDPLPGYLSEWLDRPSLSQNAPGPAPTRATRTGPRALCGPGNATRTRAEPAKPRGSGARVCAGISPATFFNSSSARISHSACRRSTAGAACNLKLRTRTWILSAQSSPPKDVSFSASTFKVVFSRDSPDRISTVYLPGGRYRLRDARSGSASRS